MRSGSGDSLVVCDRDPSPAARAAASGFADAFGRSPSLLAFAPGRINLIGEHVDYCDGLVMPLAIGWGCASAIGPGIPGRLRVAAVDLGERIDVALDLPFNPGDQDIPIGSWGSMVAGAVARAAERAGGAAATGVDLAISSSVPVGAGLSSSAAVEVSCAFAMAELHGLDLCGRDLARLCQKVEHDFVGTPCGVMDQFASACGKSDHVLEIDCRSLGCTAAPLPSPDQAFIIAFDSGVSHSLAASAYAQRREACERAAKSLNARALRDVSADDPRLDELDASDTQGASERDAAVHVTGEIARVEGVRRALAGGDLERVGDLLNQSHASLRDRLRVSCDEVDTLQRAASACQGVFGARMTGGGFGGCCIALVTREAAEDVARRVTSAYRDVCGRNTRAIAMPASDGVRLLPRELWA